MKIFSTYARATTTIRVLKTICCLFTIPLATCKECYRPYTLAILYQYSSINKCIFYIQFKLHAHADVNNLQLKTAELLEFD